MLTYISLILFQLQKYFNFVHGDLSPKNIMLIESDRETRTISNNKIKLYGYIVKIIDFGFACIHFNNNNVKYNLRVPVGTYKDNICNQKYIDLLFLLCRISSKQFRQYNIPSNILKVFRFHIKKLIQTTNMKDKQGLQSNSINNYLDEYSNLDIINKEKKIEYKIGRYIADKKEFHNLTPVKFFYPKSVFDKLQNIDI